MCWDIGVSIGMTAVGVASTGFLIARKQPAGWWLPLGYFTFMELLQALSYPVVDQCDLGANQLLTLLSFIHIAFQPLFINILCMSFLPATFATRIKWPVIALSLVSAGATLSMLYPFEGAGLCSENIAMCARRFCTYMGNWHLAWDFPLNGTANNFGDYWYLWPARAGYLSYILGFFILPAIYGAWRLVLALYIFGPLLVQFLTDNPDEQPAVWCLFSIAVLLIILTPAARRFFTVARPPIWMRWIAR